MNSIKVFIVVNPEDMIMCVLYSVFNGQLRHTFSKLKGCFSLEFYLFYFKGFHFPGVRKQRLNFVSFSKCQNTPCTVREVVCKNCWPELCEST